MSGASCACQVHVIYVKIASVEEYNQVGRVIPAVWTSGARPGAVLYLVHSVLCLIKPCSASDHQVNQRRPR